MSNVEQEPEDGLKNVKFLERGKVKITCPSGHTYTVEPLMDGMRMPDGGYLYSSIIDFCRECETPIDWQEKEIVDD